MRTSITIQKLSLKILFMAFIFVFASCEKESLPAEISSADASANASEKAKPSVASQQGTANIASIVISASTAENEDDREFTYLLQALVATDLAGVFAGTDNYTVFAPTDAAFIAALGENPDWENIDKDFLSNILLYHVTDGRRFSNSVVPKNSSREIETLQGGSFYVSLNDEDPDNVKIEIDTNDEDTAANANIISANITATNGVIHVIDAVLIPTE